MASKFEFRVPSLIEEQLKLLDKFIAKLKSEISLIGLTYKQTDIIVKLMNDLLSENHIV